MAIQCYMRAFTKTDHMLDQITNFKLKSSKVIQSMFFDHNEIKLGIIKRFLEYP